MADLDKIRAVTKQWAPRVATVTLGAVAGVSLGMFAVRAVAGFAADKSGTVMAVSAVLAIAAANALWWWYRGRDQAAKARAAVDLAAAWSVKAAEYRAYIATLERENTRLTDQVERLTPGEVVSLLTKRMGDTP